MFELGEEKEKREKAADNMIVLAKENAGAELLYNTEVVPKIVKTMKVEKNQKIR